MHANMEIHKEIVKMNFKKTLGIHHSDITFTVSYFFFISMFTSNPSSDISTS